jgi:NAD(P)-dependent dehydrogenase (short-subunit alcohol dehydrogenase family)
MGLDVARPGTNGKSPVRFHEKIAYVTGAGHGIGRAVALRLAAEQAAVVVSDVDADAARDVAGEISRAGGTALATTCDVTVTASVDASFAEAMARFGRLDILVNTAGGDWEEPGRFEDVSDELWQRKLDLKLSGVARCIRAALPGLLAAAPVSSVVSISSINASIGLGGYPYSSAKAGLEILTKNLAVKYGGQGVRFNVVSPGTVRTRHWDRRQDDLSRLTRLYPLGRVGEPEDIAAAAAFLASDDAGWITGVTLPVDGGYLAGPRSFLPED